MEVMYAGDARVKFALQGLDCEINQVTFCGTIRIVLKSLFSLVLSLVLSPGDLPRHNPDRLEAVDVDHACRGRP